MQYARWILACLLLLTGTGGCFHAGYAPLGSAWNAVRPFSREGAEVDRQPIRADVSSVPSPEELAGRARRGGDLPWTAMGESETQQLAASRAVMADLLLQESDAVVAQSPLVGANAEAARAVRMGLAMQSVEERNRAAASALELLLRLAEAEAGLERLAQSEEEVQGMAADLERVRAQGLSSPLTNADIDRQRWDLVRQAEGLRATRRQLHRQLADLLALDPSDPRPVWPAVDLTVTAEPIDEEEAVATALATRADLAALRYFRNTAEPRTLPAIQQALSAVHPGLGVSVGSSCRCRTGRPGGREDALQDRSWQLEALLADRERAVVREVRAAVQEIETRLRQVATARRLCDAERNRLENLRQQQLVGAATPLDIRRARLEVIKSDQQLLSDVIQWKIAVVKLKAAQGLLAAECGYSFADACHRAGARSGFTAAH